MKFFLVLMLGLAFALPAEAATLALTPAAETAGAGRDLVLTASFVPEGVSANVIEGSITVPQDVLIDRIDTSVSALSLWPQSPMFVLSENAIDFVGGAPGTLPASADSVLFVIHAHARNIGSYAFSAKNIRAYSADGSGGALAVAGGNATVTVDNVSAAQHASYPSTRQPLIAAIGSDPSVYDGKLFVAFYGGDAGAGVDHYEVREGWWGTPVRADKTYVLVDQSQHQTIFVYAVASDGTHTETMLPAAHIDYYVLAATILAFVLAAFLIVVLVRRRKR